MLPSTNPSAILGQGTLTQKFVFCASNFQLSPLIRNVEGMYMDGANSSLLADLLLAADLFSRNSFTDISRLEFWQQAEGKSILARKDHMCIDSK